MPVQYRPVLFKSVDLDSDEQSLGFDSDDVDRSSGHWVCGTYGRPVSYL